MGQRQRGLLETSPPPGRLSAWIRYWHLLRSPYFTLPSITSIPIPSAFTPFSSISNDPHILLNSTDKDSDSTAQSRPPANMRASTLLTFAFTVMALASPLGFLQGRTAKFCTKNSACPSVSPPACARMGDTDKTSNGAAAVCPQPPEASFSILGILCLEN